MDTIRSSVRERGYPPSLRELTAAVGISSSSTASEQLRILQRHGYIRVAPNVPRGILLLDPIPPTLEQAGINLTMNRDWQLHPQCYVCPGCGREKMHTTVGLHKIAQVYDVCTCRAGDIVHDHLIEQLWHRDCLTKSGCP